MAFAQRDYPEIQGINGRYTIAEIGCFITSGCNLELDYGKNVSPVNLNNFFRDKGVFIDIDDGVRDDLTWSSISQWDPDTQVIQSVDHGTAPTAGWPSSNQAIVRFYYRSTKTGQMTFHFCKVANADAHTIIDSWDGVLKTSPYGEPTAWATYRHVTPAAVTPPPYVAPFQSQAYDTPKQVKFIRDTHRWAYGYPTVQEIAAHPVGDAKQGDIITVYGWAHHVSGNDYYIPDLKNSSGYNIVDCEDYTPPVPVYTPPAAPLPVPKAPQYTLVTTVMAFKNASDAVNHNNAQRTLKAGTYYVFNDPKADKQYGMYNLTARADKPGDLDAGTGGWINPRDNVLPEPVAVRVEAPVKQPEPTPPPAQPTPETAPAPVEPAKPQVSQVTTVALKPNEWKTTNVALRLDRQADIFYRRDSSDITVYDLDGSRPPITLKAYTDKDGMNEPTPIPIISTFWKDGVEYGRTPKAAKEGWWYGVPMSALDYGSATTIADRVANNTAKFGDRLAQIIGGVERLIQDVKARKAKK